MRPLLQEALRKQGLGEVTSSSGRPAEEVDAILTVGLSSLRQVLLQEPDKPVVAVMVTRAGLEAELASLPRKTAANPRLHVLVIDQPPGRYFDLIRQVFPQRRRVGLLLSTANDSMLPQIEKSALTRGLGLNVGQVQGEASFVRQLDQVLGQSEVFLALPDSEVHNRNTVQPLLLTTYRAGVPVVAYSEAYVQSGALLGLYSTPEQLARQAVHWLAELLRGRGSSVRIQMPQDFTISVNATVARSLGLVLPSSGLLLDRMRGLSSNEARPE